MKSCFKQIDKNSNVWYKHIYLDDAQVSDLKVDGNRWVNLKNFMNDTDSCVIREYRKDILNETTFCDDKGNRHYMLDICNIGFDDKGNIDVLYVLEGEDKFIVVTEREEIQKIKNYFDNNKCDKK